MKDALDALRGAVRPIVTFAAVGAFIGLAIDHGALVDAKEFALFVAAFWFASRKAS